MTPSPKEVFDLAAEIGVTDRPPEQSGDMQDYTTTVTILESITDAIFILNGKRAVEYANHSAQDYLQLPLEEIIGLDLAKFISSDDDTTQQFLDQDFEADIPKSIFDQEVFSNSEAVFHGAREQIPVLINFSVIPDSKGNLNYIIVVAKEIAYRKSLEKELRNRQALSVSFDRLKALGEMSVGLVHTLGQPAAAMELRLEHLGKLTDPAKIQNQITELRKDIAKISGIVEKVRSYAQVMSDKQNRPMDINQAILAVLRVLEYDLSDARITVDLDLEDPIPAIEANEPELEQVFINLLANAEQAFKATDNSGDRIVAVTTKAVENKWIQVSIRDNAGGIPDHIVPRIFEPFFSNWDTGQHAGTGLSVAKSILASLGGDLNYYPEEEGSDFELRIPIAQQEERTQLFNLIELLNS